MYFILNDYCMVKPSFPPTSLPRKIKTTVTTLRHKNRTWNLKLLVWLLNWCVVIESMCSHFFFLNMPSVYMFTEFTLWLKAHVHPNGFVRLCFCFETTLLSNAVFWLASTFEERCVTTLKTTARETNFFHAWPKLTETVSKRPVRL